MTITLDIPIKTEQKLQEEAKRLGVAIEDCALQLIDKGLTSGDEWTRAFEGGNLRSDAHRSDEQTRRAFIYDDNR